MNGGVRSPTCCLPAVPANWLEAGAVSVQHPTSSGISRSRSGNSSGSGALDPQGGSPVRTLSSALSAAVAAGLGLGLSGGADGGQAAVQTVSSAAPRDGMGAGGSTEAEAAPSGGEESADRVCSSDGTGAECPGAARSGLTSKAPAPVQVPGEAAASAGVSGCRCRYS